MYTEKELVGIAKRKNNTKRKYLVVNRLQGKHVPVAPTKALEMFHSLAELTKRACSGEKLLLIGFAETATAIGSALAVHFKCPYLQTTRENIPGADYLYFSESHSHATEQRLVRGGLDQLIDQIDRIVFVEDEVTTGNTILNIIKLLQKEYPGKVRFSVASILNGMNQEAEAVYQERGISLFYLIKTCHDAYTAIAESYKEEGLTHSCNPATPSPEGLSFEELRFPGAVNARVLTDGAAYASACRSLWEQLHVSLPIPAHRKILVLGTEEFMYPALYIGRELELQGHTVLCHSTTRSPITPGAEADYPLHGAYELVSMYEDGRTTYLYDLDSADLVLILTDSPSIPEPGRNSLLNALVSRGNSNILLIRWCCP